MSYSVWALLNRKTGEVYRLSHDMEKIVFKMAEYVHPEGFLCANPNEIDVRKLIHLSETDLADMCGVSVETMRKSIDYLVKIGYAARWSVNGAAHGILVYH